MNSPLSSIPGHRPDDRADNAVSSFRLPPAPPLLSERGFASVLYGAFGSSVSREAGQSLLHGFTRTGDDLIRSQIFARLDRGERVDALEIASGPSYPITPDGLWGAPFAARKIALEAAVRTPGKLSLLVTDLTDESRTVKFHRFSDSVLCWSECVGKPHSPRDESAPRLQWVPEGGRPAQPGAALVFYRPLIDAELEACFGLEARGGVSFFDLGRSLPGRKFDVIFARNLPPYFYDDRDLRRAISAAVRAALKPGGEGLLYFEERLLELRP